MKRPLVIVVALLAVAALLWGLLKTPGEDAPPPLATAEAPQLPSVPVQAAVEPQVPSVPTLLVGRVIHRGKPVPSATVRLRQDGVTEVQAGADGAFLLEARPGEALVSATSDELASDVLGPLLLSAGERREGVVLELFEAASAEGTVRDARTRVGVAGARVASTGGAVVADAAGRFRLKGISYQQAWLDVSAKGYLPRMEWLALGSARAHRGLEVLLTPASTVTGRVVRLGVPVEGAEVRAESLGAPREMGPARTGADGRFALDVADGASRLVVAAIGAARIEGPRVTLGPGATEDVGDIELGAELTATGQVLIDGVPGAGVLLALVEARGQKVIGGAMTDAVGRFTFQGVPVGSYLVQVRRGSLSAQAGPFEQTGEGTAWTVEVSLGAGLRGRVEPPSAGVRVWWLSGDWAGPAAETVTDAAGEFQFDGVPRGTLMVEAEGPAGQGSARASAGTPVVIRLGRGALTLTVVDAAGQPVTDYVAKLRPLGPGMARRFGVLSADGVLRLPLPPGRWEVVVEATGFVRSAAAAVDVGRGEAELRVSLKAGADVRGTVRDDATGLPMRGVTVMVVDVTQPSRATVATVVKSDDRGEFLARGVPEVAQYQARHPLYQVKSVTAPGPGRPIDIRMQPAPATGSTEPPLRESEGVGMTLGSNGEAVLVGQVFPASPAEAAGVLPGDRIVAVDGVPARPPLPSVVSRIVGPSGSLVRLTLQRGPETFELQVRRRAIQF